MDKKTNSPKPIIARGHVRGPDDEVTRREAFHRNSAPHPSLRPISAIILQVAALVAVAAAVGFGGDKLFHFLEQEDFSGVHDRFRKFFHDPYLDNPKKSSAPPPPQPQPPKPPPIPPPQPKPEESPESVKQLEKIFDRVNALMNDFSFMKHLKEGTLVLFPQGCGGFVVARNALVTAAHCFPKDSKEKLEGAEAMIIGKDMWTFTHKPYFLKHTKRLRHVVVRHPTLDLAVIVFSQPYFLKSRILPVAEHPIDPWAPVIHCGHPAEQLWNVKGGYVLSRDGARYRFVSESYPGSSGGTVINETGEVVSVVMSAVKAMVYDAFGPVIDRAMIAKMVLQGETELGMHSSKKPPSKAKSKSHAKKKSKKKPHHKKPFVFPADRL